MNQSIHSQRRYGKVRQNFITFLCMLYCFISLAFLANTALADNALKEKSRPAETKDVIGVWEMYYQTHKDVSARNTLFFAPHQRFEFHEDGYVKNLASTKPFDPIILATLSKAPKSTRFNFVKPGVLTITRSVNDGDRIIVSVIIKDMESSLTPGAPLLKSGDLILSYLTPQKQLYMQRYFKRAP